MNHPINRMPRPFHRRTRSLLSPAPSIRITPQAAHKKQRCRSLTGLKKAEPETRLSKKNQ